MLFDFLHRGEKCRAFVNEKQLKPDRTLIVYLLDCNSELGYELVFIPREEAEWDTIFSIKSNHPDTFREICQRLHQIFSGQRFSRSLKLMGN